MICHFLFVILSCHHFLLRVLTQEACTSLPGGTTSLTFTKIGDINIGLLTLGRDFGSTSEPCSDSASHASLVQSSVAFTYAVERTNQDDSILPNISLGFTISDDCYHSQTGLLRALGYVKPGTCDDDDELPNYEVVAVLSLTTSASALVFGHVLNVFRIPTINVASSAARLSDRESYRYMVRGVQSDNYQAVAIISILQKHNWTYISTISTSDDYGRDGIREVHRLAEKKDICVAYSKELAPETTEEVYQEVVQRLLENKKARVIVFFAQTSESIQLMRTMQALGAGGQFVIVACDAIGVGIDTKDIEKVFGGALLLQPYVVQDEEYENYYNGLTMADTKDPWLKLAWSTIQGCSWNYSYSETDRCREDEPVNGTGLEGQTFVTPLMIDSVRAIAQVIHDYISENCPQAFQEKQLLKMCLQKRENLLPYLYNVKFTSVSGDILGYDKDGDVDGKYQINQMILDHTGRAYTNPVGLWVKKTQQLDLQDELFWQHGQLEASSQGIPESVCAKPCKPGHFLIKQDVKCCWECERCRPNEIVTLDGLSCRECPRLTWPEPQDFLQCVIIEPSFTNLNEPLTLLSVVLSALGLVISFCVLILMQKHSKERLIKATSKELSMISLFGVILSFTTAVILLIRPIDALCYITRFGFNLSFAFAYAPLLTKVARIYRIFSAGQHGVARLRFVGTKSQIIFTVFLILVQVILSVISVIIDPPMVELRMPNALEEFVEMLCHYPRSAIIFSLTYNLLLMIACTILAFKARKLPENFNESRYIFVCVCTTLFLWVAFIPTYFTAFYAMHKMFLLVCILFMNSVVFLLCLYLPRLCAVVYINTNKHSLGTSLDGIKVGPATVSSAAISHSQLNSPTA